MQTQRGRCCPLVFRGSQPARDGRMGGAYRRQDRNDIDPADRKVRVDLHFRLQRVDARNAAVFAAGTRCILLRRAFVTVMVAVFTVMLVVLAASFVCQHGMGVALAMRMMPTTAECGVDEQHGGRQIGEKCLHGNPDRGQRSIIPFIEPPVNPTWVKAYETGKSLHPGTVSAECRNQTPID